MNSIDLDAFVKVQSFKCWIVYQTYKIIVDRQVPYTCKGTWKVFIRHKYLYHGNFRGGFGLMEIPLFCSLYRMFISTPEEALKIIPSNYFTNYMEPYIIDLNFVYQFETQVSIFKPSSYIFNLYYKINLLQNCTTIHFKIGSRSYSEVCGRLQRGD